MSVTWLFFRWVFILGGITAAICYLRFGDGRQSATTRYESFPLIQGERATGMPLAGVSIDPTRREVYAVIGGPAARLKPIDFFIHWKSESGKSYAVTFAGEKEDVPQLVEIQPDGAMTLLESRAGNPERQEGGRPGQIAHLDAQLRPAFESLPGPRSP